MENTDKIKKIPSIIREARIASGLTMKQVSTSLECANYQVVQQWELGTRPVPDDKKRALAKLIGLTVDDLVP